MGHLTAKPGMLLAMRVQSFSWALALSELIDNSFDAGATRVRIAFRKNRVLEVYDNGSGCDDLLAMLTIGEHNEHVTTKLGRYGVGLKDTALWLFGTIEIHSVRKGIKRICSVNWGHLTSQDTWDVPDPIEQSCNGEVGTKITFRNYEKNPPGFDKLIADLSFTFSPALEDGKQIEFEFPKRKLELAKKFRPPPLDSIVNEEFSVGGKAVRLHAGIVQEGHKNEREGFAYSHHHRVIMANALGSGGCSTARVCGQVWLDNSWTLNRNKDGIADDEQEELGNAVFERCKAMLEKADTQALTLASSAFCDELSSELRSLISNNQQKKAKEKRASRCNETGSVTPVDSGKKRLRAKSTQPGDVMAEVGNVDGLRVEWRVMEDRSDFGYADCIGKRVLLNQSNEYLRSLRDSKDTKTCLAICGMLWTNEVFERKLKQKYLPNIKAELVMSAWAELMSTLQPVQLKAVSA